MKNGKWKNEKMKKKETQKMRIMIKKRKRFKKNGREPLTPIRNCGGYG